MAFRIRKSIAANVSFLIFATMLLFAVLVTAVGWTMNSHIEEARDNLELVLQDQAFVESLHSDSQTVVSDLRAYLAFGREDFLKEFLDIRQTFDAKLTDVSGHFRSRSYGEPFNGEWEAIRKAWDSYLQSSETMIALRKSGNLEQIETMSRTVTTSKVTEMSRNFQTILDAQNESVKRGLEDNRRRTGKLSLLPVWLIAVTALASGLLIVYLRRRVISPILRADAAVNRIAAGDYALMELSGRSDELGRLERGINFMSDELRQRHVALAETNKELIDQRDLLEAQNEEISAQQIEQQEMLIKLTDRERELELITMYQEKLTGHVEMNAFLEHSIRALLQALNQDAVVLIAQNPETALYDVVYAYGYPPGVLPSTYTDLYGPGRRALQEKQPLYRVRMLRDDERGIHNGYDKALDQYYPLLDEYSQVIGLLLITAYGTDETNDTLHRLTNGLVRQFGLAYLAQRTNEERRKQSYLLEELYEELSQERDSLEQQRDLVRRIIESIHEGMVMCDGQGRILFSNERMNDMFAFDRFSGSNVRDFGRHLQSVSTDTRQLDAFAEAVLDGSLDQLEERFSIVQEDGRETHFEIYVNSIVDAIENTRSFLFVFRDRTSEERADEMKNEFISIVSHELRTPLASVLGFMEILLHRDIPKPKQQKYMETIYKEANRLSNLINDFLDLQRMESGKQAYQMIPFDVSALVREVAEQWQGKQDHRIELRIEPGIHMTGDVDRMTQVMHNLLSNAIKYSPEADRVAVHIARSGDEAVIEVQDFGLGIPDEAKDKLFTKFYRVDNSDRRQIGGTGLGLSIVKEIVESHQGSLTFESELGVGSIFRIRVGMYRATGLGDKVVIIEDDENLSKLIAVAFEKLNVSAVQLRSAEDALLSLNKTTGHGPLICIVDVQLDGPKTGWDFIAELLRHPQYRNTPVIVSTVLEPPKHYYETETGKYLRKPFTIDRLLELAVSLMELPQSTPTVVFPTQDEAAITSQLEEKGIRVADWKVKQDIIEVEVRKHD
ncbi:ATP-binding protein [Paenibacillus hodogayensis]|uniref:histidine kinase n=1 Tax=Paenibacillus hodogayensis TaxID=279208 RepID=A0ABV5VRY0_9BACL